MDSVKENLLELIKLSRASSRVKWLKVDKTDVSRETETEFSVPEDEDGDDPRNVGFIYF
jgi:hypothetical protein